MRLFRRGVLPGYGTGGPVNINLVNSRVVADGVGSAGILAQSDGTASNPIALSIDRTSMVQGGLIDPKSQSVAPSERDVAAIRLLGGTANKIRTTVKFTVMRRRPGNRDPRQQPKE